MPQKGDQTDAAKNTSIVKEPKVDAKQPKVDAKKQKDQNKKQLEEVWTTAWIWQFTKLQN